MKKFIGIAVLLILCIGGYFFYRYWTFRNQSIEYIVRTRLYELADLAGKKSGDKLTDNLLKSRKAADYFADPSKVEFNAGMFSGAFSRERIANESTKYRMFFKHAQLKISDLRITRNAAGDGATAEFAGSLTGELKSGNKVGEGRDMRAVWKRDGEGVVRLESLTVDDVVQK